MQIFVDVTVIIVVYITS